MYTEQQSQPSLLEQTAQQAAAHAARKLAQQALTRVAAILGAKVGTIVAVVLAVIALIILLVVLIVSVAGAAFQSSTAVWPVPVATDAAGLYTASGWAISSRFGWRDGPSGGTAEFHDGIDLANPQGACPFGYHCGTPAMFDGQVQYVGWDRAAGDPSKTGGGELVILRNGEDDHETLYAHLEPYRLYVQLEGKIKDSYDHAEYRRYQDYRPIGQGELTPDLRNSGIAMTCLNDMPNFLPTRTSGGSVVFLYDRPASCTTTVIWGERGGKWKGWIPDQPPASDDARQAELAWATPIDPGRHAKDVALRFRAHLVPPDPPPSPTAVPSPVGAAGVSPVQPRVAMRGSLALLSGQGSLAQPDSGSVSVSITPSATPRDGIPRSCVALPAGWVRCTWSLADIPTEQERFAQHPDAWLSAARANAPQQGAQPNVEGGDGAIVPPAQLLPTMSSTAVPISTPAPASNQGSHVAAYGIGAMRNDSRALQTTPAEVASQATISPADRQWLTPDGSATWTIHLANNQRGSWSILVGGSDGRLVVRPGAACSSIGANGWLCLLPGTAAALTFTIYAGTNADGLTADIPIAVTDAEYGAGPVVGDLRLLMGVGTPPTATPTPSGSPTPLILPTPPPMPPSDGGGGGGGENGSPDCVPQPLIRLPNVIAPQPRLIAPAAASFAAIRQELIARTGIDALAVLADVLRTPFYTTDKPGVLSTSWHKAGRAIDLNLSGPFVRVPEGRMFRLYLNNVDITAIFEAHGWNRIPVQGDTLEWWHYEWHPDGIAWSSAMLQVWDLPTLRAAFPEIDWASIGCTGGSNSGNDPAPIGPERAQLCTLAAPSFGGTVEYIDGCGPPVRAGDQVYQLDTTLGFVGLTGNTTGPHLHLGLKVQSYDGSWPSVDICTPAYLDGRTAPSNTNCYTDMADPLAFLPRAPGGVDSSDDPAQMLAPQPNAASGTTPTPIIAEGAPYQLPPPNYPDSLVFTPIPGATPVGQYWSPYADGGQYGGGGVGEWFCAVWSGWPWCS